MRKFFNIALALLAVVVMGTSCDKNDYPSMVEGEWRYTTEECDIYVAFGSTGTFELFQRLGQGRYYLYNGSWDMEDERLSGEYNDGNPWGSSYEVSFDGSDKMTLRALNGSAESNTYLRTRIPEEVRAEAQCAVRGDMQSAISAPQPLL